MSLPDVEVFEPIAETSLGEAVAPSEVMDAVTVDTNEPAGMDDASKEYYKNLSHEEKMAIGNASRLIGRYLEKVEQLNGAAARRLLAAMPMPGTDWRLDKYTSELEKEVFHMLGQLMDSKIILMLSALEKAGAKEEQLPEAAAETTTDTTLPQEVTTNGI